MMAVHSEDDISLEIEVACIIGNKSSSSLWFEEQVETPVDMLNILYNILFTGFYTYRNLPSTVSRQRKRDSSRCVSFTHCAVSPVVFVCEVLSCCVSSLPQ